jgi:hypothetical protein
MEDNTFTPEELAWRLVLDENINSAPLIAFSDENTKEILFEILITIYVEMIFNYSKLKFLENKSDNSDKSDENFDNNFDNFKINLNTVNINDLTNIFTDKFHKLKFILNVTEITREQYNESKKKRYCTVMLKDSPTDYLYFEMNKDHIDPEKRYHFVLNNLYKEQSELKDIFCSFNINNKYYKIYFVN